MKIHKLLMMLMSLCWLSLALAASDDGIALRLNGAEFYLGFDDTAGYSSIVDGSVQASFFTYGQDPKNIYELYMVFPEDVKPGDVITPEYAMAQAPESSVALIITIGEAESYYFAGQVENGVYPEGSNYAIHIDQVSEVEGGLRYAGTLSGVLVGMDVYTGQLLESVTIDSAPFHFTMPASNRSSKGKNPFEEAPTQTTPPIDLTPVPLPETTPEVAPSPTPAQTWRV